MMQLHQELGLCAPEAPVLQLPLCMCCCVGSND